MKSFTKLLSLVFNKSQYLENQKEKEILANELREKEQQRLDLQSTFYHLSHKNSGSNHLKALTNLIKNGYPLSDYALVWLTEKISNMIITNSSALPITAEQQLDLNALVSQLLISSHKIVKDINAEHSCTRSGSASSHLIYKLIHHEKMKTSFHTLPVREKISFLNNYTSCINEMQKNKDFLSPLLTGSENFIKEAELSLEMSLEELNNLLKAKNFSEHSMQGIEHIIQASNSFSTPLGKKCFELQEKIFNIQKNYSSCLEPEDTSLFKKILEQDIPKLLPGASLTIPEISQKYEELSGKPLASSLEDIANKYLILLEGIEAKCLSKAVEVTDKNLKAQELYLDKKIENLNPASGAKTMKMSR